MSNEGRLAVISGSSSGIGQAVAKHLLGNGWQVIGLDISRATITDPRYRHFIADLADTGASDPLLESVEADAFVHAAGILQVGRLGELDLTAGASMWKVHAQAASSISNALIQGMVRRGWGRVIFVGSRVSSGLPGRGQYAATKAALVAMARSWAAEVASSGVTINVVSPAATDTGMLNDPARAASKPRLPPIGRLIRTQEIAELVGFLLSPGAAAITGQEIVICGGASLNQ